jgi:lysophospholipase L1-like esterase
MLRYIILIISAVLLSCSPIRTDQDKTPAEVAALFRNDKLHLTEKGYAVWTEIIKNYINFALQ